MQNNDDDDVVKMKVLTGKKWTNFGVSRSTFPLIQDSYFYCNEVRHFEYPKNSDGKNVLGILCLVLLGSLCIAFNVKLNLPTTGDLSYSPHTSKNTEACMCFATVPGSVIDKNIPKYLHLYPIS
ncbi:hypothetical protein Peur_007843 [Populus x canadensis]